MSGVTVVLGNGALGATIQTSDGICGMVLTGVTEGEYTVGTPLLITSLAGLEAYGITRDNNDFALRQVRDFYTKVKTGAQLYLMLVANTVSIAMMADKDNPDGAVGLLNYAEGKIKVLGIMTDDALIEPDIANGLNEDIPDARLNMTTMAEAFAAQQMPFRAIIGGTSYSGVAGDLATQTINADNRVAILIGDKLTGAAACLGLALGVIASVPVQRKISRVENGPLGILNAYVGSTNIAGGAGDVGVIASKGYITFKTFPHLGGYYFSGDPTCTTTNDDYRFLALGRVIDKAHILAYLVFVQKVDGEVPVDTDGKIDAGFCAFLQQQMENQINRTMTAGAEISGVTCYIDPEQDIIANGELVVEISIRPVGYAEDIVIRLGFINPNS